MKAVRNTTTALYLIFGVTAVIDGAYFAGGLALAGAAVWWSATREGR